MFLRTFAVPGILFVLLLPAGSVWAQCAAPTSTTVKAIPFDFYITRDKGRWITLAATSNDIEFNNLNDGWPQRYKAFRYGDGGAAISEWRLDSVPSNGTLFEGSTPLSENDTITDPDELFYTPDIGFTGSDPFGYCVTDSSGRSVIATVTMHVENPSSYPMPVGVPSPGFGINEEPPADPSVWPNIEASGNYYIDSDHPACSNSNTYGTPNSPRCGIPYNATIGAGQKMVLASSSQPYPLRAVSWDQIYLNGTAANPAWVVGDDRSPVKPRVVINPALTGVQQLRIRGTGHYRISGIDFDGPTLNNREGGDNTVLRYSRIHNNPSQNGGGTSVGLGTGINVLAFHVNAHDNGIVHPTLGDERDIHAFVGTSQRNLWMLDVLCSENAGDCVQLTNRNTTQDVYLGRAIMHSMMENCVDYKDFNRFVVSESDCWDLRRVSYTSGSGGLAQNFYVNDEGTQQNYGYFLNNRSWDTSGQAFGAANIGGRVYFIGNRAFFSPAGTGLGGSGGGGDRHYYFNTVYDVRDGMGFYTVGSAQTRWAAGNYVGTVIRFGSFMSAAYSNVSGHDYNIYGETMTFAWGSNSNPTTGSFSAFTSATGFDLNSNQNVSNENFFNAADYDFRINSNSALRDYIPRSQLNNIAPGIADLLADLGIGIIDFMGTLRSDSAIDVGANEYDPNGDGGSNPPPPFGLSPPMNLRIN